MPAAASQIHSQNIEQSQNMQPPNSNLPDQTNVTHEQAAVQSSQTQEIKQNSNFIEPIENSKEKNGEQDEDGISEQKQNDDEEVQSQEMECSHHLNANVL